MVTRGCWAAINWQFTVTKTLTAKFRNVIIDASIQGVPQNETFKRNETDDRKVRS